jgi:GT2 family glycosyltransferase
MLPKISLIITSYGEKNQRYLDLCLKSVENLNYPKELLDVVVVSSGDYIPKTAAYKIEHNYTRMHFPAAVNYGVARTDPTSKYLLILNDDTILTKNCLLSLSCLGDAQAIVGATSPCDNNVHYNLTFGYQKDGRFKSSGERFHRYDDWAPDINEVMNAESLYNPGSVKTDFLCFYAVLIPRKVWETIGVMDENYKTGQDDIDYSLRAKDLKIYTFVFLNCLIWHFGGIASEEHLTTDIRKENRDYFQKKWGFPAP